MWLMSASRLTVDKFLVCHDKVWCFKHQLFESILLSVSRHNWTVPSQLCRNPHSILPRISFAGQWHYINNNYVSWMTIQESNYEQLKTSLRDYIFDEGWHSQVSHLVSYTNSNHVIHSFIHFHVIHLNWFNKNKHFQNDNNYSLEWGVKKFFEHFNRICCHLQYVLLQ